jgi:hypothetical protein
VEAPKVKEDKDTVITKTTVLCKSELKTAITKWRKFFSLKCGCKLDYNTYEAG